MGISAVYLCISRDLDQVFQREFQKPSNIHLLKIGRSVAIDFRRHELNGLDSKRIVTDKFGRSFYPKLDPYFGATDWQMFKFFEEDEKVLAKAESDCHKKLDDYRLSLADAELLHPKFNSGRPWNKLTRPELFALPLTHPVLKQIFPSMPGKRMTHPRDKVSRFKMYLRNTF